jgi:hypothetical protein
LQTRMLQTYSDSGPPRHSKSNKVNHRLLEVRRILAMVLTEQTEVFSCALRYIRFPVQNSDLFRQITPGDPLATGKRIFFSWSFCAKFRWVCPG